MPVATKTAALPLAGRSTTEVAQMLVSRAADQRLATARLRDALRGNKAQARELAPLRVDPARRPCGLVGRSVG